MKYLCVGYLDQQRTAALSKEQLDAVMSECPPFMDEFYASGKVFLVAGTSGEVKDMRRVGGEVKVTDVPAGGSREVIGCVFLVEAKDMDDALRVAALHPTTRIHAGEQLGFRLGICPVHYFEEKALKKDA